MERLVRAQRAVFEDGKSKRRRGVRTPEGGLYPIYVRIMDRKIQGDRTIPMEDRAGGHLKRGPRAKPRRSKGGEDMLLLPDAIPVIGQLIVEPRIEAYMSQGMTRRSATKKVAEEILKKDYAQGCKDGSVNRHSRQRVGSLKAVKTWASFCPTCGHDHEI